MVSNPTLIKSYVNSPRFIERPWLAKKIETALSDPNCRFMLLTAEPGAGKTAFMAWLASQHPDWPRYFIRRDSQTPSAAATHALSSLQSDIRLQHSAPRFFKHVSLKEEIIDPKSEQTQIDLRRYAENFAVQELIKQTLSSHQIVPANFIDRAVMKADGNFQYLAAIFRGIEKSIELNEKEQLEQLLRFENVPTGLGSLYSFFLTLIKNSIQKRKPQVI